MPRTAFEAHALTFAPILEERVWGGGALGRYGKDLPAGKPIGESWEISDVEGRSSIVDRGPCRGMSLRRLLENHAPEILGDCEAPIHPAGGAGFPLLFKLLDARQDLSVQVHPSDEDFRLRGSASSGKTEAWVILEAEPGARVIHGLAEGVDRERFFARMAALGGGRLPDGELETWLRCRTVSRGDVVFVPAGTLHAVGAGIVLLEVQQTSDVTYRVHDWGRPGRDLHVEAARDVISADPVPCPFTRAVPGTGEPAFSALLSSEKFRVEIAALGEARGAPREIRSTTGSGGRPGFHVLSLLDGCALHADSRGDEVELRPGKFALLPAALGAYTLSASRGGAAVLRFSAPANAY